MRKIGGVYKRGSIWWIHYRIDGVRYHESAETGDKRAAESLLAQRRREIADGTWKPATERGPTSVLTVRAYLAEWISRRVAAGVRGVRDEERYLLTFVVPEIGDLALADVTRTHVRDVMTKASRSTSARTGEALAPRTLLHVYRAMTTAFSDAVLDRLIPASPCTLRTRRGELPKKRDKDPKWRAEAVYTREETETLISDDRIPADRRAFYALMLLAGLRSGEASARRWRDYDTAAAPLGRLTVATQSEGGDDERETKTGELREVPVHPTLAAILAEWKLEGFPLLFGRAPRADDPIVPSRASTRDRFTFRSKHSYDRLLDDLDTTSMRRVPSARHAMRATFLSLLEVDGANMAIARRATHAAPSDVVGGYIRTQWADVCREIGKLQIARRGRSSNVVTLPIRRVANGPSAVTETVTVGPNGPVFAAKVVGGTGFEPATSGL